MPNARERGNNILRQPEGRLRLRHQQIVEVRSRNCVPIERMNIGKCVVDAQEVLDDAYLLAGVPINSHDQVIAIAMESDRSEEHTSELQSLMSISYAVFCL